MEENDIQYEIYILTSDTYPSFQVKELATGEIFRKNWLHGWFYDHTLMYLNRQVRFIEAFAWPPNRKGRYEFRYTYDDDKCIVHVDDDDDDTALCEIEILTNGLRPAFQARDMTTGEALPRNTVPEWFYQCKWEYLDRHVRYIDAFEPSRDHESEYEIRYVDFSLSHFRLELGVLYKETRRERIMREMREEIDRGY